MDGRIEAFGTVDETAFEDEAVGGPRSPMRRCVVTGAVRPREEMIRFVLGPDDSVVPDLAGDLPGRGYWITADREAVERAVRRNAFARAARRPVRVDPDLADRVAALLSRRFLEGVGLARRAGRAVAGFEKVRAALKEGGVGLRIEARDGAPDGRAKLDALAAAVAPDAPVVGLFDSATLGEAFGRERAVHAAVGAGPLADRLSADARRLEGLTAGAPAADENEPGPPGTARGSAADRSATGPTE